jgi:FlaA1/EpsC-like NDP-sugar epimerase
MTIPEAAQLVIQASAMASGGDVFVLDMGQPVKIMDLAHRMVSLSGLTLKTQSNPNGDIEIQTTGLRPGEKLYEELLIGDQPMPTLHPGIMKANEEFWSLKELEPRLKELEIALDKNDKKKIRSMLQGLIPGYQPENEIVDWIWLEKGKLNATGDYKIMTSVLEDYEQPRHEFEPRLGAAT